MRKLLSILLIFISLLIPTLTAYGAEPTTPSGIPLSELEGRIDEMVADALHRTAPGVAIVVFNDGEIIFSRGYGYVDLQGTMPIDPATTIFEYGSVSKMNVWIAVMQLVEQGLLDLDNYVNHYLPEDLVQQLAFEMPFTLRDLINHTAGFGGHLFDVKLPASHPQAHIALQDAVLASRPCQLFKPGTTGTYSNFGVVLAALAVEYVTGQHFYVYERENILIPAGMESSFNQPELINNHELLQSKAIGHTIDSNGRFQEDVWSAFPIYPAGGLNGTAEDFARFAMALTPPQGEPGPFFEDANTISTIFSPSSPEPITRPGTTHGLWRWDRDIAAYGHVGLTISFSSYFAVVPDQRFGFVIHTNAFFGTSLPLIVELAELLLGDSTEHTPQENLPSAQSVSGTFVVAARHDNFMLEFIDYTQLTTVTALDDNTINVDMVFMGVPVNATYVQVEPYVFRLTSGTPFMRFLYNELRFGMEDGVPAHIIVANGFDLTALPQGREMPILVGSLAIILINFAYFLIIPLVVLLCFIFRRNKININRFYHFSNMLLLCGTLFSVNHMIFLFRISITVWRTTSEMMPHLWINYVLLGLTAIAFVGSLLTLRRDRDNVEKKRIVLFIATVVMHVLTLLVLFDWGLFVLR